VARPLVLLLKKTPIVGIFLLLIPLFAWAQSVAPIAVTVHVSGNSLAWGDLIDYDNVHNIFTLSSTADDPNVYGVATENPPVVLVMPAGDVPVVRAGVALVNVTLENGAIRPGNPIVASSIAGKAMRAASSSAHIIGYANEAFDGLGSPGGLVRTGSGKNVQSGTIAVLLSESLQSGTGVANATPIDDTCTPTIKCVPFGLFVRYMLAGLVAFGSVYLAFKSFMTDAVNGVISVGRNPRARGEIQGMVAFNAVLASSLALAGLIAGVVILFIQI
jgi:F0F1-type ATP synthase membrane subunit c/vacuolar-type H+-ATPase subunit K